MKRVRSIISLAVSIAVLLSALPAPSASVSANSGIVVNTHQDSFSLNNDGICSLREAITIANQGFSSAYGCSGGSGGADTITFAGNYTITLGSELPAVTSSIIIQGIGTPNTIIQANAAAKNAEYRILRVTNTGSLSMDGLTVRHGQCTGSCASFRFSGGGIYNEGTLTISNVAFNANAAVSGGGIFNNGSATLTNVTFSDNTAGYGGGMNNSSSSVLLTNVTFNRNTALEVGGGMYNFNSHPTLTNVNFNSNSADLGGGMYNSNNSHPTLTNVNFNNNSADLGGGMYNSSGSPTLTNVTFRANSAESGGGIYTLNNSHLTLTNVTFSANFAESGGGIYNDSSAALRNVTFYTNLANHGGGIYNHGSSNLTLINVIIANSLNGDCITSSPLNIASSNNLIVNSGSNACGLIHGVNGNIIGQNISLGAISDNGGFTQTHALLPGSPAIDNGTNTGCPAVDQRGVTRPQGSRCDIGAYEYKTITSTFADVPVNGFAWAQIESIYAAGITGGCGTNPLIYCPNNTVTRAQMAIFLLRGKYGSSYTPPAVGDSTGFTDVPANAFAAAWIKQLAAEGITGGCGGGNYCPDIPVTRSQMAIFLLRAKYNSSYTPPAPTGAVFNDIPANAFAAAWIEKLVADGITSGCGGGNYCPNQAVTRSQMAIFLQRTFNLPMP